MQLFSSPRIWKIYSFFAITSVLAIFTMGIFSPMSDPDLGWHLKSGERIVTERSLPTEDIFAFTSESFSTTHEANILRGYPISQVLLYTAHQAGGSPGVLALRVVLLLLTILILIQQTLSRQATGLIAALLFSLGLFAFFNATSLDRPHLYSFLFFPILISLMRPIGRESWLILPLMMIWANCHGGFIIGIFFLCLYSLGRLLDVGLGPELKRSILWVVGGCLATLLNPNGWQYFTEVGLHAGTTAAAIIEYRDIFTIYEIGNHWVLAIWGLSLLAAISQFGQTRRYWSETLLLGAACLLSLSMIRTTGFFVLGMLPLMVGPLSRSYARLSLPIRHMVALAIVAVTFLITTQQARTFAADREWMLLENNPFYPHAATEFLHKTQIKGHIFNEYDWGGYLIWKLYPRYQVFVDGRNFDDNLFQDARDIGRGSMKKIAGTYEYEALLNKYDIEFTLFPLQQKDGSLFPLLGRLLDNPFWEAAYHDDRAIIFIKKGGQNDSVLKKHQINKHSILQRLLKQLKQRWTSPSASAYDSLGYASALVFTNQLPEAHKVLTVASQHNPNNEALQKLKKFVENTLQGRQRSH
jgi:hypothetical protein